MNFLLAHWHCIVPIVVIAAVLLLQDFGRKNKGKEKHRRRKNNED